MTAPKILDAAIAAARKAGENAASDWESGSGISIDDHRMVSLMNFERDVVQSTALDGDALPQWRAFLNGFDKAANTCGIDMDDKSGRRFHVALCSACEALDSLKAMIPLFPHFDVPHGKINPEIAVRGVLQVFEPITSLMMAMINYEEKLDEFPGLLNELKEVA